MSVVSIPTAKCGKMNGVDSRPRMDRAGNRSTRGRLLLSETIPSQPPPPFLPLPLVTHLVALTRLPHALGSVCHGKLKSNPTAVRLADTSRWLLSCCLARTIHVQV